MVANCRVQYTAPHCGVRVLYRLGAQGADPGRRGDIGTAEHMRLGNRRVGEYCRTRERRLSRGRGEVATSIEIVEFSRTGGPIVQEHHSRVHG